MLLRLNTILLAACIVSTLGILYVTALHLSRATVSRSSWLGRAFMSGIPPAGSLYEWLASQKQAYLADAHSNNDMSRWILTTGNEAGDLDSLASAVALAYLQTRFNSKADRHIPLIQTDKDDLRLRPENVRSLEDAHIPPAALLWVDEANLQSVFTRDARLILVDHNRASSRFGDKPTVLGVMDHHEDEGLYRDAVPRVVQKGVGSCSSLVTTHYTKFWQVQERTPLMADLASLLSDAILIDTINLKNVPGKAGDIDYTAFSLLAPYRETSASLRTLAFSPESRPLPARFELLSKLKTGISHLSPRDLLRRDYKEFSTSSRRAGFSTVPQSLEGWDWHPALRKWAEERQMDVAFILTSYEGQHGKRRKDVVALIPSAASDVDLKRAIFEDLPRIDSSLELEDGEPMGASADGAETHIWKQRNTSKTRKQVAPAVLEALKGAPKQ